MKVTATSWHGGRYGPPACVEAGGGGVIVAHVGAPMSGVVQTTEDCAGGGDVVDAAVTGAGVDTGEKPVRRRNVGVGGFVGAAGFVGTVAVLTHR